MTRPPLTAQEQKLVVDNTGLVGWVLQRRRCSVDEWDDQFQDGMLGLMRAAQMYEPAKGYRFSTYAVIWIRQAIGRGVGNLEGSGYRRAVANREDWEKPWSIDRELHAGEPGDDPMTIGQLLEADDDPAGEALGGNGAGMLEALAGLCKDAVDIAVVAAVANGRSVASAAGPFGLSTATVNNRFLKLKSKARHPVNRDRMRKVLTDG